MNSYISTIDYYLPNQKVKTKDMMLEAKPERLGFSETMIEDLIGVKEVRHATEMEAPSTLAINAAEKAIAKFEGNPDDIGLIVFCGIDRDYIEPSTAHVVQAKLGLKKAICFDITNACLGFMTGIQVARSAINMEPDKHVLVCTGEHSSQFSKIFLPQLQNATKHEQFLNKIGALTLGDAGVAAIISPSKSESHFVGLNFVSKGELSKLCHVSHKDGEYTGQMKMREICNAGLRLHKKLLPESLSNFDLKQEDVNCFITHQVGQVAWDGFSRLLGFSEGIMTKTFDILGNITSATFGVNYALALEQNQVKKGDILFGAMAGSGLTICQIALIV